MSFHITSKKIRIRNQNHKIRLIESKPLFVKNSLLWYRMYQDIMNIFDCELSLLHPKCDMDFCQNVPNLETGGLFSKKG